MHLSRQHTGMLKLILKWSEKRYNQLKSCCPKLESKALRGSGIQASWTGYQSYRVMWSMEEPENICPSILPRPLPLHTIRIENTTHKSKLHITQSSFRCHITEPGGHPDYAEDEGGRRHNRDTGPWPCHRGKGRILQLSREWLDVIYFFYIVNKFQTMYHHHVHCSCPANFILSSNATTVQR